MIIFGVEARGLKHYHAGTERTCAPAATLVAFAAAREAVGITRLANVTGLDRIGIPVFMAVRPNARSLAVSQGKGADADAARASAMMEAIELWHAEHVVAPLRHDSYRQLARDGAVLAIEQLPLRPRAVVRRDVAHEWIAGEDLATGTPVWVPFEAVSMNTVIAADRHRTFAGGTNGLASGNEPLEAIVHGLLELVERDAVTLFHLGPDTARDGLRVRGDTVEDPICRDLLDKIARAGLEIALWDVTADTGVPCCLAALADPTDPALGIYRGYGAHLDGSVALARAITEAAQSRLTAIAGSRDDNLPGVYSGTQDPARVARERQFYFDPAPARPWAPVLPGTADFAEDLEVLLARLRAVGVAQVVAVPLAQPALGVPVVKVFAPGLEHYLFAPGWQPGARARRRAS
ncbi:MAG: YcaO-like family protein [Gammaproteobacteria bacterium]|nr:YcaO-like family protein [Gammaproteobacteria bacterium]